LKIKHLFFTISYIFILHQITYSQSEDSDVSMFIFGHSLINHEFQINETPSQETSTPHWIHFLSQEAGNEFKVSGQYGFLQTHANLPPISQWSFDFVEPAWGSDYVPFAEADFSHILLTPANFIQWQGPTENYPYDNLSPVDASNTIINWCDTQIENLNFYIYENWPDMAPYLSDDFPPSISEWNNYNEYTQNDFATWFDEYYQEIKEAHPDKCIRMIPIGRLISTALQTSPYDQINMTNLYEDNAPHGRPSIYFMAAMITYMAVYEELPPSTYQPSNFIDPIIAENYQLLSEFFWEQLLAFNEENESSKVFCNTITATTEFSIKNKLQLNPNPAFDYFQLQGLSEEVNASVFTSAGNLIKKQLLRTDNDLFLIHDLPAGLYYVKTTNLIDHLCLMRYTIHFI